MSAPLASFQSAMFCRVRSLSPMSAIQIVPSGATAMSSVSRGRLG